MKQEKFKIIQFSKELIVDIDNYLDNFPRKDLELKNKIFRFFVKFLLW